METDLDKEYCYLKEGVTGTFVIVLAVVAIVGSWLLHSFRKRGFAAVVLGFSGSRYKSRYYEGWFAAPAPAPAPVVVVAALPVPVAASAALQQQVLLSIQSRCRCRRCRRRQTPWLLGAGVVAVVGPSFRKLDKEGNEAPLNQPIRALSELPSGCGRMRRLLTLLEVLLVVV
jgi:hypothetical protein